MRWGRCGLHSLTSFSQGVLTDTLRKGKGIHGSTRKNLTRSTVDLPRGKGAHGYQMQGSKPMASKSSHSGWCKVFLQVAGSIARRGRDADGSAGPRKVSRILLHRSSTAECSTPPCRHQRKEPSNRATTSARSPQTALCQDLRANG